MWELSDPLNPFADLAPSPSEGSWHNPCSHDPDPSEPKEYEAAATLTNILYPVVGRIPLTACSRAAAIL